jgi:hypothetical protein
MPWLGFFVAHKVLGFNREQTVIDNGKTQRHISANRTGFIPCGTVDIRSHMRTRAMFIVTVLAKNELKSSIPIDVTSQACA